MTNKEHKNTGQFDINQLADLTGYSVRSIRYYVQQGLVDKPEGVKRQAFYKSLHLEQLMLIKKGQEAGFSLERINQMIRNPETFKQVPAQSIGSLTVKTHIQIAKGVEMVISPEESELTADQVRELAKLCINTLKTIKEKDND